MRLFVSGSAPLPAQVLEEFRERFGHTILERYGMSENAHEHQQSLRRRAAPGQRRTAAARACSCAACVRRRDLPARARTSSPATGAAKRPRAPPSSTAGSAPAISPTRSPDGYYTLCGRKSDLIISGGFNIYPREIEEFLQEQEEIAEAAVVGVPDPVRGEVPVAYVVLQDAPSMPPSWKRAAARSWRRSRCRAPSSRWTSCRATPWAKIQKHLLER